MNRPSRRGWLAGAAALGLAACAPPRPAAGAGEGRDRPLDLSRLEARHGGRLGVVAEDGARAAWRADERFLYASTFKLFLAAAHLETEQSAPGSLAREVLVRPDDIVFHAPVTGPLVGQTVTLQRLCEAAVTVSDNPAANLLIRELGGLEAFAAWYRSIGDRVTRVDRWETALNRPEGELDTTTPAQAVANIAALLTAPRPRLDESRRALLEGWMAASPTGTGRIRAGLPRGWAGATKTGTSGAGHANDIGLVRGPSGQTVRIAVYYEAMTEGPSQDERDAVIAEAARAALEALGHG